MESSRIKIQNPLFQGILEYVKDSLELFNQRNTIMKRGK